MSKADNIAKHRLGVARKALKEIADHTPNLDYDNYRILKYLAEMALKDMEDIK